MLMPFVCLYAAPVVVEYVGTFAMEIYNTLYAFGYMYVKKYTGKETGCRVSHASTEFVLMIFGFRDKPYLDHKN